MKLKKWSFIIAALFTGMFVMSSCEMTSTALNEDDLITAEEDLLSDVLFDDAMESADEAVAFAEQSSAGGQKSFVPPTNHWSDCRKVTVERPDSARWPKTITIDWGDGCTSPNGVTRSGMIIITIDAWMGQPGSSRTVEFIEYTVNDIMIEGTKTITNMGRNDAGNLYFKSTLEDGKLTIPVIDTASVDSSLTYIEITKEFTREKEWAEGEDTRFDRSDDIWYFTGYASGTNCEGEEYTRTITYRLEKKLSCEYRFFVSGTIDIQVADRPLITVDFGNGICDNIATVTVDGETKEIVLKRRHRCQISNRPK